MPTDLPPDYKPKPKTDPASPDVPGAAPTFPPVGGGDTVDPGSEPRPGADVVDPPIASGGRGDALPAGLPVF